MIFFNSSTHLALHGHVGAVISSKANYCIIILLSSTLERGEMSSFAMWASGNKSRINFKTTWEMKKYQIFVEVVWEVKIQWRLKYSINFYCETQYWGGHKLFRNWSRLYDLFSNKLTSMSFNNLSIKQNLKLEILSFFLKRLKQKLYFLSCLSKAVTVEKKILL